MEMLRSKYSDLSISCSKLDKICDDEIHTRVEFTNTLVQLVYARQRKWLGDVLRMDDKLITNKVLQ